MVMNKGQRPAEHYHSCPYNVGVECDELDMQHDCFSCGWFPMEERRRRKVLRELAKDDCLRREGKRHV